MKFTFGPESRPLDGYTIKRAIHRGGFGEVYYALTDAGKEVALKLLKDNQEIELRGISQCLNLKHPNLVTIFDVKTDKDDDNWIVMEYVGGQTLVEVVQEHPNGMPMEDVLHWLKGITAGIEFLHGRGLVHRDLKPGNIFSESKVVKVGDVGLSKFIAPSKKSAHTQSVGTVYYMAPEVARGRYGREVDVYAMGIIVHEMLTGHVPFDGESAGEILMKHLSEKPDLSRLPATVRPIVEEALIKDPEQRVPTLAEFTKRFEAAVLGNPLPPLNRGHKEPQLSKSGFPEKKNVPLREVKEEKNIWEKPDFWAISGVVFLILFATRARASLFEIIILGLIGAGVFLYFKKKKPAALSESSKRKVVSELTAAYETPVRKEQKKTIDHSEIKRIREEKRQERIFKQRVSLLNPDSIRKVPWVTRLSSAVESSLFAIPCTAVIVFILLMINEARGPQHPIAVYTFHSLALLIGAWFVIFGVKLMEGFNVSLFHRRSLFFVLGLIVGGSVFGLDQFLFIDLPGTNHNQSFIDDFNGEALMAGASGSGYQPTLLGYMTFFCLLFALPKWHWHADSLRPTRFRIWNLVSIFIACFIIVCFFAFSWDVAMMWAISLSAIVQLSSTWLTQPQRMQMVKIDHQGQSPKELGV